MKIYVASSWRNEVQQRVVALLKELGHEVYDFKHPEPGSNGFSWSQVDPDWQNWTPAQYRYNLECPIAKLGFNRDMSALRDCDICVLVLPCGRSAHLEAGFAIGQGKPTIIMLAEGEPELMYKMAAKLVIGEQELIDAVQHSERQMKKFFEIYNVPQ